MANTITLVILCALVFSFTFVNGFHDGCNVVATLIASRAMRPKVALAMAGVVEFLSPFAILVLGASVSGTMQKLVNASLYSDPSMKSTALAFITAGIVSAISWNLLTWKLGIPASSSHALIGGVVGAGLAAYGASNISWDYFFGKVVLMIFLTPAISFAVGFVVMKLMLFLLKGAGRSVNKFFVYIQWLMMAFLAFNHSYNDSQKSLGIIMILMSIFYGSSATDFPLWGIALAALMLSSGIMLGGFGIIKTVGTGIYRVRPVHSFASQFTAGAVILGASMVGAPVSASQIVSSSIMGVGSAEHYKHVHWGVMGKIITSWIITIPIVGTLGAILFFVFQLIF